MERHSRKLAKKIASDLQKSRERTTSYRRSKMVNRNEYKLIGTLKVRYKHPKEKMWTDLGVVSEAIVTSAAISILINVLRGGSATTLQNFKYHDSGINSTSESASDTTLGDPVNEGRDVGTQENPAVGVYRSVAIHTYFATATITEHGIFSATSGGTLLDRSVFGGIDVVTNTQLEFTYDLSLTGS